MAEGGGVGGLEKKRPKGARVLRIAGRCSSGCCVSNRTKNERRPFQRQRRKMLPAPATSSSACRELNLSDSDSTSLETNCNI